MTREEAVKEIIRAYDVLDFSCHMDNHRKEAFNMAKVALEQEPMRDATPEERESVDKYVKSISKPTGVNFWNLEQEPCEDAISRQAVLDEAFEVDTKEYGRIEVVGVDAINSLPPVTPKPDIKQIRQEIKQAKTEIRSTEFAGDSAYRFYNKGLNKALNIIDKYKAESEG